MTGSLTDFTTNVPFWKPRITPVAMDEATQEQLDAMKTTPSDRAVSEYVLVLAHDPKTLKERTPLFNGIMYSRGGLSRAETELSAVAASVVNRCIYCTAVHASRYNELTKDDVVMKKVFAAGENADIDPRSRAILHFASKLSMCPSEATRDDVKQLVANGLGMDEVLDSALSAALFGWANRLMHTLGDPIERDS